MLTFSRPVAKAALIAILLGSSSLVSIAHAADTMTPPMESAAPAVAAPTTEADHTGKMEEHVEVRIKTLHDGLKITKDQEAQWQTVAQTMRDNEAATHKLVEERHAHTGAMSALDDIKSYQAIAQSHADGLSKFITAFEPLYVSMSDAQKKSADAFFGKSQKHWHKHEKKADAPVSK